MIRLSPLLLLAACAPGQDAPPAMGAGSCDAAAVQNLVGKPASEALGADALARSGARVLRWLQPGQIVTMEFRADRLNLHLDDRNVVERVVCS